jgi:hypothetical protein
MLIVPHPPFGHPYWAIWLISLQLCSAIIPLDSKVNGKRKEAMIARFDHRPMLTAVLALSTTVLFVVVITLSTLLITLSPEATSSTSDGGNAAAPAISGAVGSNSSYNTAVDRHAEMVAAYYAK